MNPLRIVLAMVEAPVPFGNAAARWFYVLLRELVARGHRVSAFAACSKPAEMDEARRLFPAPAYDLRLYPFPVRKGLAAKLETLRRPYSYMFSAAGRYGSPRHRSSRRSAPSGSGRSCRRRSAPTPRP